MKQGIRECFREGRGRETKPDNGRGQKLKLQCHFFSAVLGIEPRALYMLRQTLNN
jgi:hypothetical protein